MKKFLETYEKMKEKRIRRKKGKKKNQRKKNLRKISGEEKILELCMRIRYQSMYDIF